MFWRTPQGWSDKYAVDSEGRLILGNWEGDSEDYVIVDQDGEGYLTKQRTDVQIPELNTWGNSPKKATLGGDNDVEISYDGQNFVMANDGSTFSPELQDYQP